MPPDIDVDLSDDEIHRKEESAEDLGDSRDFVSSRATSTASEKSGILKWKRAAKDAQMLVHITARVDMQNKIGAPLEGWFKEVAFSLQAGVSREYYQSMMVKTASAAPPDVNGFFEAAEADLFAAVREACGMPEGRYAAALGLMKDQRTPSLRLVGSSSAAGRSGAFFFLTADQQLIAKSCTREDYQTLLRILPAYLTHMTAARTLNRLTRSTRSARPQPSMMVPVSSQVSRMGTTRSAASNWYRPSSVSGFEGAFLPRYLGLYTLRLADSQNIRIVVMSNVFAGARRINRKYDLKGSTVNRMANAKERAKASPVYKDIDWLNTERRLSVGQECRSQVMRTLFNDVDFLVGQGLIDYSLLIGIHDRTDDDSKKEANGVIYLEDDTRICYLGIVDVLTTYGWRKGAETLFASTLLGGRDISCQPPRLYGERFLTFMETKVFAATE